MKLRPVILMLIEIKKDLLERARRIQDAIDLLDRLKDK
jgi:hypothetical protein